MALDDLNAWMANPLLIGEFSSLQVVDAWFHGCGLTNYFRELKPGMTDAYTDLASPVRLCLFVEPVHLYRGSRVRLEAVLVNLDALPPGSYPLRLEVVGPHVNRIYQKTVTVEVPEATAGHEPPFARLVFSDDAIFDAPSGRYRFLATFEHSGAAAGGGETSFYLGDRADMPAVEPLVTLWGDDPDIRPWLDQAGIRWQAFDAGQSPIGQVILASGAPLPAGIPPMQNSAGKSGRGAGVVFLTPELVADPHMEASGLSRPELTKTHIWYFRCDHWAKEHPLFAGLPSGGLLDYRYYRDIVTEWVWNTPQPPHETVCGAHPGQQRI